MRNTAPTARRQQRKRGDADKAVQGDEDVTHQFSQGPGTEEIHKKPRREGITRCAGLAMRMGAAPAARISRHRERGPRTWRRGTGLPAPAKEPGDPSIGPPGGVFESRGASGSRLRSEAVIALLARLNIEVDEHNPADHRNETEKQPPAAAVDVVQAANADGNAGQD